MKPGSEGDGASVPAAVDTAESVDGPAPSALGPGPEFDLIRSFLKNRARSRHPGELVGPGDDCAVVVGGRIAISCDMSVEGVHFRREWLTPREIGWRAASASLSDLAAVAARPIGVLISCAISETDSGEFAVELMAGVNAAAEAAGGTVLGGDLTRSPGPLVLDVCVVGEVERPVLRSGAHPGDEVWVTGTLGGAGFAVARLLREEPVPPGARERFAHPVPRIQEALWLARRVRPTSLVDLSDGLAGDVAHIAAASGVDVLIHLSMVPQDPGILAEAPTPSDALDLALSGGEDYELCFTAPPGSVTGALLDFEREFGIPLTAIGVVETGSGMVHGELGGRRTPLGRGGFQHFRKPS